MDIRSFAALKKSPRTSPARKGYLLWRNVYQQDELSPVKRVALFAVDEASGASRPQRSPRRLMSSVRRICLEYPAALNGSRSSSFSIWEDEHRCRAKNRGPTARP